MRLWLILFILLTLGCVLPQKCALFDSKTTIVGNEVEVTLTGLKDSDVVVTLGDQNVTIQLPYGHTEKVRLPLTTKHTGVVNGTITALNNCAQTESFGILVEVPELTGGVVEYLVGDKIRVHKKLNFEGIESGITLRVPDETSEFEVAADGYLVDYSLEEGRLQVPHKLKELDVRYAMPATVNQSISFVADQILPTDSKVDIPVTVRFEPDYAPYGLNGFSFNSTAPPVLKSSVHSYTSTVGIPYGPDRVRIDLDITLKLTAKKTGSARLEVVQPTSTSLQTIERVSLSPPALSTVQKLGKTYYVYDYPQLNSGETRTIHMRVTGVRKTGLFRSAGTNFRPLGPGNKYWQTDANMRTVARSLKGATNEDTVRNVVAFVTNNTTYEENDQRDGAESVFYNRIGACDEFVDLSIALLRELGIPAGYESGYAVQPVGGSPPGPHSLVKIGNDIGPEFEAQDSFGVLPPWYLEFYTEWGEEKGKFRAYGDVDFDQSVTSTVTPA